MKKIYIQPIVSVTKVSVTHEMLTGSNVYSSNASTELEVLSGKRDNFEEGFDDESTGWKDGLW